MDLAPICLFVYSRIEETKLTIQALQQNFLASESELFIFSDGNKNETDIEEIKEVRKYIHSLSGFKSIQIIESETNLGIAQSIISGVSSIVTHYGKVIVLENDIVTSRNFLNYMNEALYFYEQKTRVLSISGFSYTDCTPQSHPFDVSFNYRASSWGWATWRDRWDNIDWDISDYSAFKWNFIKQYKFNKRGGSDMCYMLSKQMKGKINSWAIRFCYHQFKYDMVDVIPKISKVVNIGFGDNAVHCNIKSFKDVVDDTDKISFSFPNDINIETQIIKKIKKNNNYISRFKRQFKRQFKLKVK